MELGQDRARLLATLIPEREARTGFALTDVGNVRTNLGFIDRAYVEGSATRQAYEQGIGDLQIAIDQLAQSVRNLSDRAGRYLAPAVRVATQALNALADAFERLPEGVQRFLTLGTLTGGLLLGLVGVLSLVLRFAGNTVDALLRMFGATEATQAARFATFWGKIKSSAAGVWRVFVGLGRVRVFAVLLRGAGLLAAALPGIGWILAGLLASGGPVLYLEVGPR